MTLHDTEGHINTSWSMKHCTKRGGGGRGGTGKRFNAHAVLQNTRKYRSVNTLKHCKIPGSTGGPKLCGTAKSKKYRWINTW